MARGPFINLERWTTGGVFLSVAVLVCAQIVCRRLFSASIAFTEEIAKYCLVWCTMIGAAAVVREKGHLGVVFLSRRLPKRWARWLPMAGLLAMGAFFALLGVVGVGYVRDAYLTHETSQGMGLPIWAALRLAVPVGSFLVVIRCVEAIVLTAVGRRQE